MFMRLCDIRFSHCVSGQPCNRQAHLPPRPHLLLPFRLSSRHAGSRRYCALQPPNDRVRPHILLDLSYLHRCRYSFRSYSQSYGEPTVQIAANTLNQLCYENRDALMAGIIVAGWDKDVGPSVYNIPLGGGTFRQPWAIGGMYNLVCVCKQMAHPDCRIWFDICLWLLRRHISGRLGPRPDRRVCQEQCVSYLAILSD